MSEKITEADVRKIMRESDVVRMEYEDSTGIVLFYRNDDPNPQNVRNLDERSAQAKAWTGLETWMIATRTKVFYL